MMDGSLDIGQKNLLKWEGVWLVPFCGYFFFLAIVQESSLWHKQKKAGPNKKKILGTIPATWILIKITGQADKAPNK